MTDMVTELSRPVDRAQLDQEIEDFNLTYPVNVDDALNAFTLPPVAGTGTAPATTTTAPPRPPPPPPSITTAPTTTATQTRPTTSTRSRPTTSRRPRPRPVHHHHAEAVAVAEHVDGVDAREKRYKNSVFPPTIPVPCVANVEAQWPLNANANDVDVG